MKYLYLPNNIKKNIKTYTKLRLWEYFPPILKTDLIQVTYVGHLEYDVIRPIYDVGRHPVYDQGHPMYDVGRHPVYDLGYLVYVVGHPAYDMGHPI